MHTFAPDSKPIEWRVHQLPSADDPPRQFHPVAGPRLPRRPRSSGSLQSRQCRPAGPVAAHPLHPSDTSNTTATAPFSRPSSWILGRAVLNQSLRRPCTRRLHHRDRTRCTGLPCCRDAPILPPHSTLLPLWARGSRRPPLSGPMPPLLPQSPDPTLPPRPRGPCSHCSTRGRSVRQPLPCHVPTAIQVPRPRPTHPADRGNTKMTHHDSSREGEPAQPQSPAAPGLRVLQVNLRFSHFGFTMLQQFLKTNPIDVILIQDPPQVLLNGQGFLPGFNFIISSDFDPSNHSDRPLAAIVLRSSLHFQRLPPGHRRLSGALLSTRRGQSGPDFSLHSPWRWRGAHSPFRHAFFSQDTHLSHPHRSRLQWTQQLVAPPPDYHKCSGLPNGRFHPPRGPFSRKSVALSTNIHFRNGFPDMDRHHTDVFFLSHICE